MVSLIGENVKQEIFTMYITPGRPTFATSDKGGYKHVE